MSTDTKTVRDLFHAMLDTFHDNEFAEGIDLRVTTAEGVVYAWFTGTGKTPEAVVAEIDTLNIENLEVAR